MFFENTVKSPGAARNRGIKESAGEIIAFLDADCIADQDWLDYLTSGFSEDDVAGCGGKILSYKPQNAFEMYAEKRESYVNLRSCLGYKFYLPYLITSNAAFRRDILEKTGMFDVNLRYHEDLDLSWRICLDGYRLKYVEEAVIYHIQRDNLFDFFIHYFKLGTGVPYINEKYKYVTRRKLLSRDRKWWISSMFLSRDDRNILDFVRDVAYFSGISYGYINSVFKMRNCPHIQSGDKIIWWIENGNVVVLNLKDVSYYSFNNAGSRIWCLLKKGKNKSEIAGILSSDFPEKSGSEIETDISEFIGELKKEHLL